MFILRILARSDPRGSYCLAVDYFQNVFRADISTDTVALTGFHVHYMKLVGHLSPHSFIDTAYQHTARDFA
jgi:hypothetical protein